MTFTLRSCIQLEKGELLLKKENVLSEMTWFMSVAAWNKPFQILRWHQSPSVQPWWHPSQGACSHSGQHSSTAATTASDSKWNRPEERQLQWDYFSKWSSPEEQWDISRLSQWDSRKWTRAEVAAETWLKIHNHREFNKTLSNEQDKLF